MENNTIFTKLHRPSNFEFPLGIDDTLFTLARNVGFNDNSINGVVSKMAVIKELKYVNANDFSQMLSFMKIEEINIFSIDNNYSTDLINAYYINKGSIVKYLEMRPEQFADYLNSSNKFSDYNPNSLYIIRKGSFIDIKNLFKIINGNAVNIGRWRGSKSPHFKSSRF